MTTVEKLLNCVIQSVADDGFENASIKRISTLADTALSTVYVHFQNKEEMFAVAFRYVTDFFFQQYASPVFFEKGDTQEQSFRNMWNKCMKIYMEHPQMTIFYLRYRHSAYFTRQVYEKTVEFESEFHDATVQIGKKLGLKYFDERAVQILTYFIESCLIYAGIRLTELYDEKTDEIVFWANYGAAISMQDHM